MKSVYYFCAVLNGVLFGGMLLGAEYSDTTIATSFLVSGLLFASISFKEDE